MDKPAAVPSSFRPNPGSLPLPIARNQSENAERPSTGQAPSQSGRAFTLTLTLTVKLCRKTYAKSPKREKRAGDFERKQAFIVVPHFN